MLIGIYKRYKSSAILPNFITSQRLKPSAHEVNFGHPLYLLRAKLNLSTIFVLSIPLQHKRPCYRLCLMWNTFSLYANNTPTHVPLLFPFLSDESSRSWIHRLYNIDSDDALCTELTDSISCKWIPLISSFTVWRWVTKFTNNFRLAIFVYIKY
jgi:hypothetical protein